jgi:hypothetical protein
MSLRRAALLTALAAPLFACGGTTASTSGATSRGSSSGSSTGRSGSGSTTATTTVGSTGSTHSTTSGGSTASTNTSGTTGTSTTTGSSTSAGSTTSAGTTGTTATAGSAGSSGSTGGCCTQACPSGCDLGTCQCLPATTTGTTGTSAGADAGSICSSQACVVYAESARTLYRVDPTPPNAITRVCDFSGAIPGDAGVNDIAVQGNGTLYGITKTDLYTIDPVTCVATHVVNLGPNAGGFNGLTFTAADTLLAADARGHVATIDTATGTVNDAGAFGGTYGCSGDIVGIGNGVIYATAKDSAAPRGSNDILVTLDPSAGYAATPVSATNDLGYAGIFGLGYWGGVLYGFDKSGNTLSIDPALGTSTLLHNSAGVHFFGAGTTPKAPVIIR